MFSCHNLGDKVGGGCYWYLVDQEARMLLNILEKCVYLQYLQQVQINVDNRKAEVHMNIWL